MLARVRPPAAPSPGPSVRADGVGAGARGGAVWPRARAHWPSWRPGTPVASDFGLLTTHKLPFVVVPPTPPQQLRQALGIKRDFLDILPGRWTVVIDKSGIVRHVYNSQARVAAGAAPFSAAVFIF